MELWGIGGWHRARLGLAAVDLLNVQRLRVGVLVGLPDDPHAQVQQRHIHRPRRVRRRLFPAAAAALGAAPAAAAILCALLRRLCCRRVAVGGCLVGCCGRPAGAWLGPWLNQRRSISTPILIHPYTAFLHALP